MNRAPYHAGFAIAGVCGLLCCAAIGVVADFNPFLTAAPLIGVVAADVGILLRAKNRLQQE